MIITDSKKHKGKPAELVLLTDPYYVKLTLAGKCPDGNMPELQKEFIRLIAAFDEKKIRCRGKDCNFSAESIFFFKGTLFHYSLCVFCKPSWLKDNHWKFTRLADYRGALKYVELYCHGNKKSYRRIIRSMAIHKGLPQKFGAEQAVAFFKPTEKPQPANDNRTLNPDSKSRPYVLTRVKGSPIVLIRYLNS